MIFRHLAQLDVSVRAEMGQVVLDPGDRVPAELLEQIRLHKADLLDRLTDDSELVEIAQQVRQRGHVLMWSNVLQDLVAFAQTESDGENVPPSFTVYTVDELSTLFLDHDLTGKTLRLVHRAKQLGGRVISDE